MGRTTKCFWGTSALFAPAMSPDRLRKYQSARLRALVRHCWNEVPFYRSRWEAAGIDTAKFRGIEDLHRLPIVTRADLRDSDAADIVARSRRKRNLVIHRTSGSSGVPLTVRRSWFEEWLLRGIRLGTAFINGDNPRRSRFSVIGRPPRRLLSRIGVTPQSYAECLEPLPQIVEKFLAANPEVVGGFAGAVTALAGAVPPQRRDALRVRRVFCGSETLTPPMRQIIREAFGVEPTVSYASHEFNLIAMECHRSGLLHTTGGSVLVEVLNGDKPVAVGERGEVVITGLHSYAMPFVRYRLADLVTRGPDQCPCGAPFSTISEVVGRMIEMFTLPGGREMHPYTIVRPLVHKTSVVRQYQIIQEQIDLMRVRLVCTPETDAEQLREIESLLRQTCGGDVRFVIEPVSEIRPQASGKYRPYYSLVGGAGPPT